MSGFEWMVEQNERRLDRFVTAQLSGVSRSQVERWIEAGCVRVNGRLAQAGNRLAAGDVVRLEPPLAEPHTPQPGEMPLTVVYEDADCLVIDKPAGLVVHPAAGHRQDTLVNALLAHYPDMAAMLDPASVEGCRPGIVHRLDKDTSGLLLVARHEEARATLRRQFQERRVEKVYLALIYGWISPRQGRVVHTIGRDPRHRQRMAVIQGGREAVCEYEAQQFLVAAYGAAERCSLVQVRLHTGRTHQIRVQLAHLGYPVVGDAVYGLRKQRLACPRQFLHAHRLGFYRPGDGAWQQVESPLPADLAAVLVALRPVE